jgi:hypothetical protein
MNDKLRRKKIARDKKKKEKHNKSRTARIRCEFGTYRSTSKGNYTFEEFERMLR